MTHVSSSSFNNVSPINAIVHNPIESALAKDIVSLNQILKNALAKTQPSIETHRIIVRCDELPTVEGCKKDMEKLLQAIVTFITSYPPAGIKQFLYVQCKEEEINSDTLTVSDKTKLYTIQFHTNIALDAYWQITHQAELKECGQIAEKHSGRFIINNIESGCLFTLHLSGKSL